jgi:hypothetical protein
MHHYVNGSNNVDGKTKSLLNKDYFPITSARENSSIEASTPNIFSSNSSPTTSTTIVAIDALTIGFSH